MEYFLLHSRQVVWRDSPHDVQYRFSIWLNSQQFSHIWVAWNNVSLRGVLSRLNHCGRIAIYNKIQKMGVNNSIIITDNNWNQNDELRALESFITQINVAIQIKKIIIAHQSRILLWNIVEKNHSVEENGFHNVSHIFSLHSNMLIAVCVNSPVSIIQQKM